MFRKKITINNENDYKHFLRFLYLYKSFLYYNTSFILENNTKNRMIDYIFKGLNIKNRIKRIEYIYDTSCKIIDDSTKNINICGFVNSQCYVQRKLNNDRCNGCCRKCLYQTNQGCSTKNLSCKLFNCYEVRNRHRTIKYEDLKILQLLSFKNRFIIKSDYFSKREDVLKDLYAYTFLYSSVRILSRLIFNMIKFNRKISTK